jgi:hypothetical protein
MRFACEEGRLHIGHNFSVIDESGIGVFGPYAPRSLLKPAGCEVELSLSCFLSGHVAGHAPGDVIRLVKIARPAQPAAQTGDYSE